MSILHFNDAPQTDMSPASMQALVSRPLPPQSDPITSKRVCFYKSGDPQFTGHRMVINSRTFKTFDALLDALSKKVPLSFGVRTITTPKGTHAIRTLDDLQDGASYLCSDRRKVKPFNLDEVHKTQIPWNTTRPVSAGRRALVRQRVRRGEGTTRTVKMYDNSVAVRTPKRLTVYKNKDPTVKRVIVLQRRTAPHFEALLDYLSRVMQFPVLKLYTEDGRKVEGLPALILCSGIVVAAGNEPFIMGNYNHRGPTKTVRSNIYKPMRPTQTKTLQEEKNKPAGTISRSRNFSLSSERYLVEQINKSLNGSLSEHNWQKTESMETEGSRPTGSEENCDCTAGVEERNHPIMPTEDDIEKSFRVNEDGSMTVEMKVHLTIKQEEMVNWTTTLSRTSTNSQQRAVGASKPGSGMNSLDVINNSGKDSNGPHSFECKEMNTLPDKSVCFIEEERENDCKASEKLKPIYRRLPTPGHRQKKETSISETEVQESTVGAYSYMERTAHGELTEGYCVVSRSSSSSTRTLSKPGNSESRDNKQKKSHSFRSSGMAEVLQLQNNGTMGITETVMHIYESQGTCDNFFANTQVDVENKPEYYTKALPRSRPGSTDSGPRSSSNDCDVDLTRQSTSSNSGDDRKNDMLSLSSASTTPSKPIRNNLSILTDNQQQCESTEKKMLQAEVTMEDDSDDKRSIGNKRTSTSKSKKSKKSASSESSGPGKRINGGSIKGIRMINTNTLSHSGSEKKTHSSSESDKHKNSRTKTFEGSPKSNLNLNRRSEKEPKLKDKTTKDISYKVNTNDCVSPGPALKINGSPVHPAPVIKILPRQRSMNGSKSKASKQKQKLSESVSLPVLQSSPSNVNQYVENWLQKIQPDSLPYEDDMDQPENVPRAVFQIGSESADGSEIKSEPEKDSVVVEEPSLEDNAVERPVSRPPVQIKCEGETLEAQRARGFCKSMPSVRVLPAEQEGHVKMHKSTENLAPPDPFTGCGTSSQSMDVDTGSGMKPVLKQLCLSIQSIRQASNQSLLSPTMKEKSSSLPDFSSQVVSAFGSPSRAFLSFLSLMTLRDSKDESQTSNSEAMQVMQSLEKISNIKDEDELKASLTSLQGSTSSQLKQSWRDFQERNVFGESPPLSPRQSEQEFALDVDSGAEGEEHDEERDCGIEQLMDELNMSGDLRRKISSLVEGELKSKTNENKKHVDNASEISGKEEENDDGSVNGSLEKAADMEEEQDCCEEKVDVENEKKDETTDGLKELESEKLHLNQSHSLVYRDSIGKPNQTYEDNCSDASKADISEISDNIQIITETKKEIVIYENYDNKDAKQNVTDVAAEDLSELSDHQNHMSEEHKNIAADIREDKYTNEDEEATIQKIREQPSYVLEPDNTDTISEQKVTDFSGEEQCEISDDQMSEGEKNITVDNIEDEDTNEHEEATIQDLKEQPEQSDDSEPEKTNVISEPKATYFTEDEQYEIYDDQNNAPEGENTPTPDNIEERDTNAEQNYKEHSEPSDISEPENTDATSEQKLTEFIKDEKCELCDDQDNVSEGENNTLQDNIEEDSNAEQDENDREHTEQSDVSEHENQCLVSEASLVSRFPDKETSELNEDNESDQFSTTEIQEQDCVNEESDHSDFEEYDGDEGGRDEQENRSVLAECKSEIKSQDYKEFHFDVQSNQRVHLSESGSQEDDQVMSPDVEDAKMSEMSQCEDPDQCYNNISPEHCSNDDNSITSEIEYDETQQTDNSLVEEKESNDEDHEISEDQDVKPGSSRISNHEVKNKKLKTSRSSTGDSKHVCNVQALEKSMQTDKKESSAACCHEDNSKLDSQNNDMFKADINGFVERQSCSSIKTNSSENQLEEIENLGMEHGYHYLLHPTEISQEILDLINSALLSSTLTVKNDSNGNLRIEPDKCKMREMLRAQDRAEDQYGQKRLLSPYTSDLSDYRSETSDNAGYQSQASMEMLSESGEEDDERLRIFREVLRQSSENQQNRNHMRVNRFMKSSIGIKTKHTCSSSLNSSKSQSYDQDCKSVSQEAQCYNNPAQCAIQNGDVDSDEGVLIDKGRWLLKENHLIRKSPPMSMGMYGNGDTTTPDTGQDNISEDAPYPYHENQNAPLAVISSSELEDLAKPPTPKCTYFNMPHSSGSDLLSDAQSLNGRTGRPISRRNKELKVSPMGETWAKKNGSLSSFASVEFKLPDGKVHPQDGPVSGAVNTDRSQSIDSRTLQEEESRVGLNLRCGQHCPIL